MRLLLVVALLAACDSPRPQPTASQGSQAAPGAPAKGADDCKLFLVKARATLTTMSKAAGVTYSSSIEDRALADCRKDLAAGTRSRLIDCVLAAPSEAAVHACFPRYEDLVPQADAGGSAAGAGAGSAAAAGAGSAASAGAGSAAGAGAGSAASARAGSAAGAEAAAGSAASSSAAH